MDSSLMTPIKNRKIIIIVAALVGLTTIVILSRTIRSGDEQPVQTARVKKISRLESKVTASGEIRPVQFYDLTAEVSGLVQAIYVHEGDTVKKGQPLVRVDPTQFNLQTQGAEATLRASEADESNQRVAVESAENNVNQAKANLAGAEADLARDNAALKYQENEFKRNEQLVETGIISKSQFDQVRSNYDQQVAVVNSQKERIRQLKQAVADAQLSVDRAKAALSSSEGHTRAAKSALGQQTDFLSRTTKYSPIDGVVSSLPVKVGEYALANFSTTPLLTVADMSEINAEIKVDETDIANVAIGQHAKIKVDALGDSEIEGQVVEKAASAITRSGQTISQTTGSQEAKDFIVKVRLNPSPDLRQKLRPGMSTTAVITTATVDNVLTIPLQAIVPRDVSENGSSQDKNKGGESSGASGISHKHEVDGVFVFGPDGKAHFIPVQTGIKGDQDIELKSGLKEGQEIITGPYKTLRTLKDGDVIKRESASSSSSQSSSN